MKEYNVGDTIYVKDTVTDIDCDDSTATYYGNHHGWLDNSCIIDELPAEPVKPVLPKEVADELDIAKNEFPFDIYIGNVIDDVNSAKASYHYYMDNTNAIINLADAWRDGYTVEKEKKYNVKVPHTKDGWYYKSWNSDLQTICPAADKKLRGKFTEAEIEHYGLQDCEREEVK